MDERFTDKPVARDAITDERPGPERWGDVPPWELPGECRLDALPHRGQRLQHLGETAFALGMLSPVLPILGLLPAALALLMGLTVWGVATYDLAQMQRGEMDSCGRNRTDEARLLGRAAVWLGLIGFTLAVPFLWLAGWA
jgi:hypothetical protein